MKVITELEIPKGAYCYFQKDCKPTTLSTKCQFFKKNDGFGVWDWCELYHELIWRVDNEFPSIKFIECVKLSGSERDIKIVKLFEKKRENENNKMRNAFVQEFIKSHKWLEKQCGINEKKRIAFEKQLDKEIKEYNL